MRPPTRPATRNRTKTRALAGAALALAGLMITVVLMSADPGRADEGHDHDNPTTTVPGTPTTLPPTPTTTTPLPTTPGAQSSVIDYGPTTIKAAPPVDGQAHGHTHTGNLFQLGAKKPCGDCYLTGMWAELVYPDGSPANYNTRHILHHVVIFNMGWGHQDATCGWSFLGFLGERFFASGAEGTKQIMPPGYGYKIGAWDSFNMIYELAGESTTDASVLIRMHYDWVPASTPNMKPARPVWLDVDQCGDSEISLPAGPSTTNYTWWAGQSGKILGMGGHLHDGGKNITIVNDSTGKTLCDSKAGYGESAPYIGHHGEPHLSSMSTCYYSDLATAPTLNVWDRVTIHANYDLPAASTDSMGIVMLWMG